MIQFIDSTETLVTDALDGLLKTQALSRLDGYPHIKVVYRRHRDSSKVAVVSGGGSGHEPAQAGFVAEGLLDAAVCGEVFASPSVEAVLAGILAVTGDAGCLLIVTNYTGDRLNFGLAAERAKAMGKRVDMVVVGDDIALPDVPQARGVAGTLFVHKIAGFMAAQGESLESVANVAREVAAAARSYGVSLNSCTIPGSVREDRVPDGKAELGLGIHGEPGAQLVQFSGARNISETLMAALLDGQEGEHVLLLNNLGGTTTLEMQAVLNAALNTSHSEQINAVVGPAGMMTSLDMHGLSFSVLPARKHWLDALQSSVQCIAWPGCNLIHPVDVQPLPKGLQIESSAASHDDDLRSLIMDSCDAFLAMQDDLNALDAKVGDGDTGSTVAQAARSLKQSVPKLPLAQKAELFRAIGNQLSVSMGGSSGVLMAILFSAASDASRSGQPPLAAIRDGVTRMMIYGGAQLGDRTMVDALVPALDKLLSSGDFAQAATAARAGATRTQSMMRARSGRSAYVPSESLQGVTDPGAEAVARYFEMLSRRMS
jgi:dihydroxyacetone kinase